MRTAILVACVTLVSGCVTDPEEFSPGSPATDRLGDGWVALPLPDSRLVPGAIVQLRTVGDKTSVRYISHLSSCGLPAELLATSVSSSFDWQNDDKVEQKYKLATNLTKLLPGAEIGRVRDVKFDTNANTFSSLNVPRLNEWLKRNKIDSCGYLTDKGDEGEPLNYVINEAFIVGDGKVTFVLDNDNEFSMGEEGTPGPANLELKRNQDAKVEFEFKAPTTIAVRRMFLIPDGAFETLGAGGEAVVEEKTPADFDTLTY